MDWQTATIVGLFLVLAYAMTLYHLAHGNEVKAVDRGAKLVLDALARDGRIAPDRTAEDKIEAVNLGEEDYTPMNEQPVPDIIIARNQKHAEQIGDRITDDLMRVMDKTV